MIRREMLNIDNATQRMTHFLGHSNIFATLSLSLSLSLITLKANQFIVRLCARGTEICGFPCNRAGEAGLSFVPV